MRFISFLIATCTLQIYLASLALAQGTRQGVEESHRKWPCTGIVPASAEKPPQHNKEVDVKLYAFCQEAILHDRGLSNTLLVGNSDRWIVEELLKDKKFTTAVGGLRSDPGRVSDKGGSVGEFDARKTGRQTRTSGRHRSTSHQDLPGAADFYTRHSPETVMLGKKLTEEGISQLPSVYLQLEGLIALCRPEFQKMFDNGKVTQERIREMANTLGEKKAAPLHQTIFSLTEKNFEELPIYAAELRRISAELDWKIVQILNPAERVRLLDTLRRSRRFEKVVYGPGPI